MFTCLASFTVAYNLSPITKSLISYPRYQLLHIDTKTQYFDIETMISLFENLISLGQLIFVPQKLPAPSIRISQMSYKGPGIVGDWAGISLL